MSSLITIIECDETNKEAASDLLIRFFREEGFEGSDAMIFDNLLAMLKDPNCWIGMAIENKEYVGIATVTAMRDIEHGRVSEIGDLYVVPERRSKGIAGRLIEASIAWCRKREANAILVTIAQDGDMTHNLSEFYKKRGFAMTDRKVAKFDLFSPPFGTIIEQN